MPIIKSNNAGTLVKEAIVLDMGDLRRQADQLREAAQRRADQIIAEAQKNATEKAAAIETEASKRGRSEGFQEGLEQGRAEGHAEALAEASQQLEQVTQAWRRASADFEAKQNQMHRDARRAVLRTAQIFAEKIVQRIIEVDPTVIADQLAEALQYVLRPTDVAAHINPADRPVLDEAMPELMRSFTHIKHVQLVHDENIARGGCELVYGQGRVDATVETQLARIAELLIPPTATAQPANHLPTKRDDESDLADGMIAGDTDDDEIADALETGDDAE